MKHKRVFVTIAALALSFGIVAATLAYFTDRDQATNVFTLGNIAVELHEDNGLDPSLDDYLENEAYRDWLAEQALLPGESNQLPKRATIKNTGANRSFVRARVLIPASIMVPQKLMLLTTDAGWERTVGTTAVSIDGNDYLQMTAVYLTALEPDAETNRIMNAFYLSPELDQDDLADIDTEDWHIRIEVDAIQADGFANAAAAFTAYDDQMAAP